MIMKLKCLKRIANIFNKNNITWVLGSSMMLYFRGIVDDCTDIDLFVSECDIERVVTLLDTIGSRQKKLINENYNTRYFVEYLIDEVEVDVVSGFTINYHNQKHYFPLDERKKYDHLFLEDVLIFLDDLNSWKEYYSLMQRSEKVDLIEAFQNIEIQEKRYPLMKIEDWVKLFFQNSYGPAHFSQKPSKKQLLDYLNKEMVEVKSYQINPFIEDIGFCYSRVYLSSIPKLFSEDTLVEMFLASMNQRIDYNKANQRFRMQIDLLLRRLNHKNSKEFASYQRFIQDYLDDGIKAIHHSTTYRENYHPHYRLIHNQLLK